ncbi:DnaJ-domain-containing protein [Rhizopogon salebrosus TDB-379]|nr:DnaJ-domain-containing protein [Rhizopogon salebrosus TDB-379]
MSTSYGDKESKEYLYSVLNVPVTASANEIRERYRALSVIFHPDKQRNDRTKDAAAMEFLELQKAYEVLSDPFLREVYDFLGEDGLKHSWPPELRSKSVDQIRAHLRQWKIDRSQEVLDRLIRPRGIVTCGIDASTLFSRGDDLDCDSRDFLSRLHGILVSQFAIRHSVTKVLNQKTNFRLTSRLGLGHAHDLLNRDNIMGTIRYQFSPRLVTEATVHLLDPHLVVAKASYEDNENTLNFHMNFIPAFWNIFPPHTTISFSRRLFRHASTVGSVGWIYSPIGMGTLEVDIHSPQPFDFSSPEDYVHYTDRMDADFANRPGSVSGFGVGLQAWSYGFRLSGLHSCIKTEWTIWFLELSLSLKASLELGFRGLVYLVTATWRGTSDAISISFGVSAEGLIMRFELEYLHQKWILPVILSRARNQILELFSAVVPSTALVLGYHFVLKPRRRRQRALYFRNAERLFKEENSAIRRQLDNTTELLSETAKRHVQSERSRGGLVILSAAYGPECKNVAIDVTVPVQALVHNSQVYVPGHRTKAGIQGFYDPAPTSPKSLRVRYLFRDRPHYAEIPDYVPIVLPMRDHLVK